LIRALLRFLLCGSIGLILGSGGAVLAVRAAGLDGTERIGPWTTGRSYGSAEASRYTRAVIARRGLLALPAAEARYYNAAVDDDGRALDGRCSYAVTGGDPGGAWWSLTLYGRDGFLVANDAGVHSLVSAALPPAEAGAWRVVASPDAAPGRWLPTGGAERFELTLRVYRPQGEGRTNPPRDRLPRIARLGCPS
jgi:hypothetical protein